MKKTIGIDLGTTNSVVAIMEGREPKVIERRVDTMMIGSKDILDPRTVCEDT